MQSQQLVKLGLTGAEAVIYSSVLKLGVCTVKDISKDTGFHRTNIYDILEQLKEKGLISDYKESKTAKYQAADPNNFYAFLNEKKEILNSIFPDLEKLYNEKTEAIQVEVFKGNEGMKVAFRDILKTGKPLYAFGVKGQLRDKLSVFSQQWLRDLKNKKIKYYGIYTKKDHLPPYYTEVKFVSEELSSPVATFIYGDKININIWEPSLTAIVITSPLVASMYKKHFDLLWKIAEKK